MSNAGVVGEQIRGDSLLEYADGIPYDLKWKTACFAGTILYGRTAADRLFAKDGITAIFYFG